MVCKWPFCLLSRILLCFWMSQMGDIHHICHKTIFSLYRLIVTIRCNQLIQPKISPCVLSDFFTLIVHNQKEILHIKKGNTSRKLFLLRCHKSFFVVRRLGGNISSCTAHTQKCAPAFYGFVSSLMNLLT